MDARDASILNLNAVRVWQLAADRRRPDGQRIGELPSEPCRRGVDQPQPGQHGLGCAAKAAALSGLSRGHRQGFCLASVPDTSTTFSIAAVPRVVYSKAHMLGRRIGQYHVTRKVGEGGMGVVYEAVHDRLKLRAAIKVLFATCGKDSPEAVRFFAEARATSTVQHSSLVRLFDFGQLDDGTVYMMMEYLDGETLRDHLIHSGGKLTAPQALPLIEQMASVLSAVHAAGIIHRDLKPSNVMLVPDKEAVGQKRVKLLDFGVAKFLDEQVSQTQSGNIVGTPRYMSPEQCEAMELDDRTDVYSLGLIVFEMLTGGWPYNSSTKSRQALMHAHVLEKPRSLRQLLPDAPRELTVLIADMLSKDPAMRPSMAAAAERLASLRGNSGTDLGPSAEPAAAVETPPNGVAHRAESATETGSSAPVLFQSTPPLAAKVISAQPSFLGNYLTRRTLISGVALLAGMAGLLSMTLRGAPSPPTIAGMVYLPGKTFMMGSTPAEVEAAYQAGRLEPDTQRAFYEREQPRRKVTLSPFFIDEHEVTNQAFVAWLNMRLGGHKVEPINGHEQVFKEDRLILDLHPEQSGILYAHPKFLVRPGFEQLPVVRVTWSGAMYYCQAQGKSLPTEAQWEYAARGGGKYAYPWGNEPPRCEGVAFGRDPGQECSPSWKLPTAVGTMPMDQSPQGVRDLAGNVEEWVLDRFVLLYPSCGACKDPVVERVVGEKSGSLHRVVRGGSFQESAPPSRAAGRSRWIEGEFTQNLGFRCAVSAIQ